MQNLLQILPLALNGALDWNGGLGANKKQAMGLGLD